VQGTKEKSPLSNKWKNSVFYSLRDFEGDQMQTAAASISQISKSCCFCLQLV
jgi:hypothetical protein